MTKLLFLGSGSAFTVGADNYQSNMLLIDPAQHKLLIDCGSDIRFSLHEAGFSYRDITDIYISHLHADHVGGMEYIGLTTRFDPNCPKPNLYGSKDVLSEIWERSLSGGMRSLGNDIADLHTFFTVRKVDRHHHFSWHGLDFQLVRVIHIHNDYHLMPSYGIFFRVADLNVFITTDTQLRLEENQRYYDEADLIFHDCETAAAPSTVHVTYEELRALPAAIRRKMWLYGYQPGVLPDACAHGFCGFVKRGHCFEFADGQVTATMTHPRGDRPAKATSQLPRRSNDSSESLPSTALRSFEF
ncbi:MAG: MBL fold metallo-hydrolase [Spirulinaceae cyanobacterium SM2_1_0]|nr:MBL fold metallo-hydrolase [Spirulinaceae cyanobacterium SM2_1_0]